MRIFIPNILIFIFYITICFSAMDDAAASDNLRVKDSNIIFDQSGRKVIVTQPFCRIVSLYGAHTENLFSLGLDAEIIGVSRNEVYPAGALKKMVFSYHDDPEKFLAVKPDLVLIRPMIDRGYPQFIRRLENSNITVVSMQPASIDEMYTYWDILGILTGKTKHAKSMIKKFNETVSVFKSLTHSVTNRKKVYFEAIHSKMKTFTPDSMAVFALETAGGINIAKDARSVRGTNIAAYGKERILSNAGKIDVYLAQTGAMNRATTELIKNEPGFSAIKAVKNNDIYIIDEMIVSRPTVRLLYGIFEIGNKLYPEIYNEKTRIFLEVD